jgi:hypothetical protein
VIPPPPLELITNVEMNKKEVGEKNKFGLVKRAGKLFRKVVGRGSKATGL